MKATFETYETLSGKFEYLMNNNGLPKQYKTLNQALDTSLKIKEETKIIKSVSGRIFFIIKNVEQIAYLQELENRFSGIEDFMNMLNNK